MILGEWGYQDRQVARAREGGGRKKSQQVMTKTEKNQQII